MEEVGWRANLTGDSQVPGSWSFSGHACSQRHRGLSWLILWTGPDLGGQVVTISPTDMLQSPKGLLSCMASKSTVS
jgi:hypothetical protein